MTPALVARKVLAGEALDGPERRIALEALMHYATRERSLQSVSRLAEIKSAPVPEKLSARMRQLSEIFDMAGMVAAGGTLHVLAKEVEALENVAAKLAGGS